MMNGLKKAEILDLMLKSLDFDLNAEEQEQLDAGLKAFPELQQEQEAFLSVRNMIPNLKLERDPSFAERVMSQLDSAKPDSFEATVIRLFPRIAAACAVILLLSVGSTYLLEGSLTFEAILGVQDLSPEDAFSYLED